MYPNRFVHNNTARPDAETMLLYHLPLLFRAFTRPGRYDWLVWERGDPGSGEPHYRIAWHFCTATIRGEAPDPGDLDKSCVKVRVRLRKFLTGNPGIRLIGWPSS
jgi:hypothetical protein